MKEFDRKNIEPEWLPLVQDYPEIFLEPSPMVLDLFAEAVVKGWQGVPEKVEDLCNLRYSLELDFGWEKIIREFCEEIRALIQKAKDNGHEVFYKTFILKEKFGEIRNQGDFYGPDRDIYWDEYREISRRLEEKSSKTCEVTGKPGELVKRNYWVKTLCKEEGENFITYKL